MATPRTSSDVVLVTGASSGIGKATAQEFARLGYRVFGTSRSERPDADGVTMLRLDVRSTASVTDCVQTILASTGRIDVLVNNAGAMHEGIAEETAIAEAEDLFATNLFGAARVVNAVLPTMRERRRGRIVNIGSLAAWVGEPGEGFYAASKAALARYTEALRHEVRSLGIWVSLIEPGAFRTDVLNAASTTERTMPDYDAVREAARRTLHRSMSKGGDPRTVAELIVRTSRARRPRARYGAGADGRWVPYLTTLLPQRLVEYLLRRSYGLPSRTAATRPH
ncbi:oxidoreductase [Glycomyces halotolerans]